MDQTRESIVTPDAKAFMAQAAGLTRAALRSDVGKVVANAVAKGPDGVLQQLTKAAERQIPDPLAQLRALVSEQGQHFEQLRSSIGQIGQSLAQMNQQPTVDANLALLNAQSEAIQGLTLLAIKGQQLQLEAVNAMEAVSKQSMPQQHPMQKWIYYMMGFMMLWSMLGIIF
jgi:hypothetical protein